MKSHTLGAAILLVLAGSAWGQDLAGRTVASVQISGLERVSEQVARAKLEVQPGQPYNAQTVARDIRHLYDLGFFASVKADASPAGDQVAVTYLVEEKRVIDSVEIVGNKKIKKRKLLGSLTLREGDSFIQDALKDEREALMKAYESKGFANTTIDVVAEKTGPSRVKLVYNVQEGKKARIHSIQFVGNDALTRRQIKKVMKTKPAFWFLGGKYDEDKLEADLKKILDEYGNHGRLEADIPKTDLVYTKNGRGMDLTVYLQEGPEYHVDTVELANNQVFDDDELMDKVKVQAGDVHNKGQVAKDAESLTKNYQDSGYVRAEVEPRVTLDRENKSTHVIHHADEAELKYVREINVTGNDTTKDEVIRREMLTSPGERYDGGAVQESRRRLDNTQYFDTIRINAEDFELDERYTDLLVDVEEGKTGTFNFGAGYSTEDGVGGFGELRLNNFDATNWPSFSGGGQQFRLKINRGDRRNEYSLSLTDPELFGYPVAGGFDLFDESYRVRGGANYREAQRGGQLRFGKSLSPYVTARSSWRFQETDLSELPFFVNWDIRRQRGTSTTVSTTWQIERNTINLYRDPTKGGRHLLSSEVAGFGGDHEFWKLEHDSIWYLPLSKEEKWVMSLQLREGWMTTYGGSDYIPLQDRFYAGGSTTVRGYDTREIGPKGKEYLFWGDDFALGGVLRAIGNLELKYRANDILRLYVFADSGGVWADTGDFSFGDFKHSVGVGMGFDIPRMGPIRVDYGFPLNPDKDQGNGRLHLSTGFRF